MTSSTPKRIVLSFGTRPEAIKMAPVVLAARDVKDLETMILVTGQHREQLSSALAAFGLRSDADLATMTDRQTLPELAGRIIPAAAEVLRTIQPQYVLVHGDTLSTFCVAAAAFLEGIPVGHVEAGLRSNNLREPFPEEGARRLTDVITDLDLPPTSDACANLLREGKSRDRIVITGNTVVDAVRLASSVARLPPELPTHDLVTVTLHRRENWPHLPTLAQALAEVAASWPRLTFVYPMHLNPAVRDAVVPVLKQVSNFRLIEPLDYPEMVALMKASVLIVTDSGGLQEEGVSLGIPVALVRNLTERPEGIGRGRIQLIGIAPDRVIESLRQMLSEGTPPHSAGSNPYGDGMAAARVVAAVRWRLGLCDRPPDWDPQSRLPAHASFE